METENENGVKNDIDDRTNDNGSHTDFSKALGGDKSIQTQSELYKNGTQGINAHIVHGIADGVFTGAECHKDGLRKSAEKYRQHQCDDDEHDKTVTQCIMCFFVIASPHENGSTWSAAHTHQRRKSCNEHDDGHADPYPC